MPRMRRRRRRFRKRRRGLATRTIALRALERVGSEFKVIESSIVSQLPILGSPVKSLLNGCGQGVDNDQRIGDQITMTRLQANITITMGTTSVNGITITRTMLIWDKQPNNAILLEGEVLRNETTPIESYLNLDNMRRFRILLDRRHTFTALRPQVVFSFYKKVKLKPRYTNAGATIANIQTGSLYLVFWSDQASGGTVAPVVDARMRVRYVG